MTIIANTTLLIAALLDLWAMLRRDALAMRQAEYSNSRFYSWLGESSELTTPTRLLPLAILIASFTTMARMSWIVVMILAAALVAQGIYLLLNKTGEKTASSKRMARLRLASFVLALSTTAIISGLGHHFGTSEVNELASIFSVMVLAVSPLLTMFTNWVISPIEKRNNTEKDDK